MRPSPGRWVAFPLFGLAAALAANALLGPFAAGVIRYRMSTSVLNQLIALTAGRPANPAAAALPAASAAPPVTVTVVFR